MTFKGDPHRTLGVVPGASLNEIRSAYRRLVKQYHPDAAGERALPRFLAIQAAYERLVDGKGRLRTAGSGRPATSGAATGGRAAGAAEPGPADGARASASRDAWRARRSGGATSAGAGGRGGPKDGGPETGSTAGARPGGSSRRQPSGSSAARGDAGRPERHGRRGSRKATPGSTTYDEAAEIPLDPAWDGGAWYGPSSGTYWTINPREYADPRKHGPEYLARARRAAAAPDAMPASDEPLATPRATTGDVDPTP